MPYFGIPIRNGLPIGLGSVAGFGVQQFSPADLFSAGEQGAWYDPSDLTTLFTDSTGTTPVTAVEQFVGLMLDKSKGLVLGPELVANGDFSNGTTGWTGGSGATLAVSSGQLVVTNPAGGTNRRAWQGFTTVAGRTYEIVGQFISSSDGVSGRIGVGTTDVATDIFQVVGSADRYFVATSTTTYVGLAVGSTTAGATATFDNISVRELPGNHATQTTSAKRPKLAARYNLLTYTEQFDNGAWTKNAVTAVNTTATTDPLGGTTADIITEAATTNYHSAYQGALITAGTTVAFSCYLKKGTWQYAQINAQSGSTSTRWFQCVIDLDTGTITQQSAGAAGTLVSATSTNAGDGWWRVVLTGSIPTDTTIFGMVGTVSGATPTLGAYGMESRLGSTSNTIYVWGADLRPTSQATGLIGPTYQRVVDAATYDAVGFLPYLQFDGLSWSMSTGSIDFSAVPTDKITVWAGVRKLSDALDGVLCELSNNAGSNSGAFYFAAPESAALLSYSFLARGTVFSGGSQRASTPLATYPAPITNVLAASGNIAGDLNTIRVNGVAGTSATGDQGAGNYGNYPLFIGARNNASVFFQGWMYSLTVRGAQSSASEISAMESWVAGKTGVSL